MLLNIPICVVFHWGMISSPGLHFQRKQMDSHSPGCSQFPVSLRLGWYCVPDSIFRLGFGVTRVTVYFVAVTMSSYVQLPCCVQKMQLQSPITSCSSPFCTFFCSDLWPFRRRGWYICSTQDCTFYSILFFVSLPIVNLFVNHQIETSLMRVEICSNLWVQS